MTVMLLHRPPVSLRRATATTSAAQPAHEGPLTGSSTNVTEYGFHIGHFDVETVGKVKLDESVLMMSNPTVVATADVCAEPQTDQADAEHLSDRPEYTSYEKLLNFSRRFDASVFLLARNKVTNEVHTLDQIAYK